MQLYIKQKAFSLRERFTVKNVNEQDCYFVQGDFFSWTHKLHVYDTQGNEVAQVYRQNWTFLRQVYWIEAAEHEPFCVVKHLSLFTSKFSIEGMGWHMRGDVWAHNYSVADDHEELQMQLTKAWFTWGDSYELAIADPKQALVCVCIALAVDSMVEDASSHSG